MRGRDAAKELTLKVNILKVYYIHDRFLRDQVYRESQLAVGWTEQKCIEMDGLAKQDHTYRLSKEEFKRYQGQCISPWMGVSIKSRLHRESGEQVEEPISPEQY